MLPLPLLTLSLWLRVYIHDTGEACYSETAVGLLRTMALRTWQQPIRPRAAVAAAIKLPSLASQIRSPRRSPGPRSPPRAIRLRGVRGSPELQGASRPQELLDMPPRPWQSTAEPPDRLAAAGGEAVVARLLLASRSPPRCKPRVSSPDGAGLSANKVPDSAQEYGSRYPPAGGSLPDILAAGRHTSFASSSTASTQTKLTGSAL